MSRPAASVPASASSRRFHSDAAANTADPTVAVVCEAPL
jgi:hypothetical protein